MVTRLRKLKITQVAVCNQGANQDADILLFKSADPLANDLMPHAEPDGDEGTPLDYATRNRQQELWSALYDKWHRFYDTFYDIIGDCDEDDILHLPILVTSIEQFCADVQDLLTDVGVMAKVAPLLERLMMVAKARDEGCVERLQMAMNVLRTLLDDACPQAMTHTTKGVSMAETLEGVTKRAEVAEARVKELEEGWRRANIAEADLKKALATVEELSAKVLDLDNAVQVAQTDLAKAKQSPEDQEAEWMASLPEPVRKRYEADQHEKMELRKRLQESEDRAEEVAYIQKTADYRTVGLVGDNWRILKAIDRMPEEERIELLRLLKAAAEQLRTSDLFKARGSDGGTHRGSEGATAEEQLDTLIKSYQEEKSCDFDTAWKAVVKKQPDLWERNIAEKRASNRLDIR